MIIQTTITVSRIREHGTKEIANCVLSTDCKNEIEFAFPGDMMPVKVSRHDLMEFLERTGPLYQLRCSTAEEAARSTQI